MCLPGSKRKTVRKDPVAPEVPVIELLRGAADDRSFVNGKSVSNVPQWVEFAEEYNAGGNSSCKS